MSQQPLEGTRLAASGSHGSELRSDLNRNVGSCLISDQTIGLFNSVLSTISGNDSPGSEAQDIPNATSDVKNCTWGLLSAQHQQAFYK